MVRIAKTHRLEIRDGSSPLHRREGGMRVVGWGLVGCGDIAVKRVAAALGQAEGSTLVAVARARAERAAEFARRHGAKRWHADWRALLRDAEVDAVYLATPVRLHAEQAVAAAEAGKHVLCEKPMALDVAGCERMIAAARANGVRLGVAYYRHHYPVVARLRELVASGAIGEPVLAQAQAFEPFDPGPDHPRAWLMRRSEAGGGPMADFGCHRIEVLLDLLGPVAEVHGFADNVLYREREVEDTCLAHLRFRTGAVAVLAVTHAAHEPRDTLDLFGTRGSAHARVLNEGALLVVTAAGAREEPHPPHQNLHQPLVEDFVAAIREEREPLVTGEIGLEVARVMARIYAG
jgi:predicted dehydrogenase